MAIGARAMVRRRMIVRSSVPGGTSRKVDMRASALTVEMETCALPGWRPRARASPVKEEVMRLREREARETKLPAP